MCPIMFQSTLSVCVAHGVCAAVCRGVCVWGRGWHTTCVCMRLHGGSEPDKVALESNIEIR